MQGLVPVNIFERKACPVAIMVKFTSVEGSIPKE